MEAKAIKYAADNGAVILQCSWGYNSGRANMNSYVPGYTSDEQWAKTCILEKEVMEYFMRYAGDPNGTIEGGLIILQQEMNMRLWLHILERIRILYV